MKKAAKKLASKALKGDLYNKAVLPKHYSVAAAANVKRGFPGRGLQVIGVTGTNGKTSTCFMIQRMLMEAGYCAGIMTTVSYGVNDDIEQQIAHVTSQPIQVLLDRISDMKTKGMDILVLEVTSHALAQFRTMGVPISIAVMTNLTHEHLDYHGTFEAYLNAKLKLFKQAAKNKQGLRLGVINADDDNAATFSDAVPNVAAYSLDPDSGPKVAHPEKLKLTPAGSSYQMVIEDEHYNIVCKLPGSFNVSNSMAAALVGRALGLDKKVIESGIAALDGVEGRMTRIDEGQNFDVIVDFAHTPDSFEKLFADIKPVVKGKLICLFGSAGRRDEAKRYTQGEIAGSYSDVVYITEEDDRDIDGKGIMAQIAEGAERSGKIVGKDVHLILDRETALRTALQSAKKGDTVILLGKGHEKTIERAEGSGGTKDPENPWEVHDWDEIVLTRKILKSLKKKK